MVNKQPLGAHGCFPRHWVLFFVFLLLSNISLKEIKELVVFKKGGNERKSKYLLCIVKAKVEEIKISKFLRAYRIKWHNGCTLGDSKAIGSQ